MDAETVQTLTKQLRRFLEPPDGATAAQRRTRARLLAAAADHFARFGYRRASIADIAAEAGVGKGTVYLHFGSKIELLSACVAREKLELIPELERAMDRPPAERLEAYLQIVIRFAVSAPLSSALMQGDRELSAVLADAAEHGLLVEPTHLSLLTDLVADVAPTVGEDEADRLAQTLLLASALPAHLASMHPLATVPADDFITTYARILARGVASNRQPRTESA